MTFPHDLLLAAADNSGFNWWWLLLILVIAAIALYPVFNRRNKTDQNKDVADHSEPGDDPVTR
ncbi:MAG: hypothetical protein Q4G50_06025 [Corynebacterium sp.]|uniref:hypothetical protein n=1 Tax=Corynebacterium sp. TaxID=1720 RepID=UPI0026DF42DA|nr:hypothetical protein [Corynebacterium sp.]MDO5669544.1 hypothetical protein [Corynebacterium sp.]